MPVVPRGSSACWKNRRGEDARGGTARNPAVPIASVPPAAVGMGAGATAPLGRCGMMIRRVRRASDSSYFDSPRDDRHGDPPVQLPINNEKSPTPAAEVGPPGRRENCVRVQPVHGRRPGVFASPHAESPLLRGADHTRVQTVTHEKAERHWHQPRAATEDGSTHSTPRRRRRPRTAPPRRHSRGRGDNRRREWVHGHLDKKTFGRMSRRKRNL